MKKTVLSSFMVLVVALSAITVAGQHRAPSFKDYPATAVYKGRNAKPVLDRDHYSFRTRIREAAKDKPNFAGEYVLAQWGCGAECLSSVAINVRTGKVYDVPFSICCWQADVDASDFELTSRLIIFRGVRDESKKDTENDVHYYEFMNGKFKFLKTIRSK